MQASPKRKTAPDRPLDLRGPFRCGPPFWAKIRRRLTWKEHVFYSHPWPSPRPFPQPRMPDEYRNQDPLARSLERRYSKKTPLMQPTREDSQTVQYRKHRLPQARCLIPVTRLPPACCSRGQVKSYFANSPKKIAILAPYCQMGKLMKVLVRWVESHSICAACGRGLCRYDTIGGNGPLAGCDRSARLGCECLRAGRSARG